MKKQFKGKQYDYRIIIEAVGLYYHFSLSYRDCAKIMRQFSIGVHYTRGQRTNRTENPNRNFKRAINTVKSIFIACYCLAAKSRTFDKIS